MSMQILENMGTPYGRVVDHGNTVVYSQLSGEVVATYYKMTNKTYVQSTGRYVDGDVGRAYVRMN